MHEVEGDYAHHVRRRWKVHRQPQSSHVQGPSLSEHRPLGSCIGQFQPGLQQVGHLHDGRVGRPASARGVLNLHYG